MTLAPMTDRTLPLADSVRDTILAAMKAHRWTPSDEDAFWATADELLADIAAAGRLARATDREWRAWGLPDDDPERVLAHKEGVGALDAYRARMAQGVGNG